MEGTVSATNNPAKARYYRRCQLWHVARIAMGGEEGFRLNLHTIEAAISTQLEREFPTLK